MEPTVEREHPSGLPGVQKIYRFENGYGASVVRFMSGTFGGSYGAEQGLWELAVLMFAGEGVDDFKLCYDTPITSDVIGRLTLEEVDDYIEQIKGLS